MARTAPPPKIPNWQKRTREHLLSHEVEAMIKAARGVGRYGNRDATLILLAYRHETLSEILETPAVQRFQGVAQNPVEILIT